MWNEDLPELYHVAWRPSKVAACSQENLLNPLPAPHESALRFLGTVKTPSKPAGAYRPPGARGQVTPLAFRREDEGGLAYISAGKVYNGGSAVLFGKPKKREVPGAEILAGPNEAILAPAAGDSEENLSKAAAKNKKKREAKKAKDTEARTAGLAPGAEACVETLASRPGRSPERRKRQQNLGRNRSRERVPEHQQQHLARAQGILSPHNPQSNSQHFPLNQSPSSKVNGVPEAPAVLAQAEAPAMVATSPGGGERPQDKKVRALLKKLRAIDDLKMRRAGGEKLEGTQIKKMGTEYEVRQELEGLGWNE